MNRTGLALGVWSGLLYFVLFWAGPTGCAGRFSLQEECLHYRVFAGGLPVGEQSLQVVGEAVYRGHPVYHIQIELRSYAAVSLFFRYRESGVVYLDKEGFFPRYSRREIKEQEREIKEEVLFFPEESTVISRTIRENKTVEKTYPLPASPCQDNLSLIYYLRTRPWEREKNTFYFLTPEGPVHVEYEHLGCEEVNTPYQRLAADKIDEPVSRITVWFARDEKAYPVKIRVRQDFGSLSSLLVKVN